MFNTSILCDWVVPPHDFSYQVENYVIPPEIRTEDSLSNVVRIGRHVVLVKVSSIGKIDEPLLRAEVTSFDPMCDKEIEDIKRGIDRWLGLSDDLKPFYAIVNNDPVMRTAIKMRYGAKDKANFSPFEAVISTVCAQNVQFKRLYGMMGNMCNRFGDKVSMNNITYSAFPTSYALAHCSLEELRACKVGYRADYIKSIAESVENGLVNFYSLQHLPYEEGKRQLLKLHGVGPYTADLCLILGFRKKDIFHLDLYVREALWQFYFKGQHVTDDVLRDFVNNRWPGYQGWAIAMLTTNTEALAARLGVAFRLKSGATI
jgi:N-glycosylase/DNA lyase